MTFPFKSISKSGPDANDCSNEVIDSVESTSTSITTNSADADASAADAVSVVASFGRKKRFMIIDETKLPKEEAERLLVKRAYNRECAERARKRSKETVQELHRQVEELQSDKSELRHQLANMEKGIERLKNKNKALTMAMLTQGDDMYSRHESVNECGLPLNSYPKPLTALSMLQQSIGDGSHQTMLSLVPPRDLHKILLLQRTRKEF